MGIQGLDVTESPKIGKRRKEGSRDSEDRDFIKGYRDEEEWGDEDFEDASSESASGKYSETSEADDESNVATDRSGSKGIEEEDYLELLAESSHVDHAIHRMTASRFRERRPIKCFGDKDLERLDFEFSDEEREERKSCQGNPTRSIKQPQSKKGKRMPMMSTVDHEQDLTDDDEVKLELAESFICTPPPGTMDNVRYEFKELPPNRDFSESEDDEGAWSYRTLPTDLNLGRDVELENQTLQHARTIIGEEVLYDYQTKYNTLSQLKDELESKSTCIERRTKKLECEIRSHEIMCQMAKDQNVARIKERILRNLDRVEAEQRDWMQRLCRSGFGNGGVGILRILEQMDHLDRTHLLSKVSVRSTKIMTSGDYHRSEITSRHNSSLSSQIPRCAQKISQSTEASRSRFFAPEAQDGRLSGEASLRSSAHCRFEPSVNQIANFGQGNSKWSTTNKRRRGT